MIAKVNSGAILGLETTLIEVEVDVASRGLPSVTIVGLADKAIVEARERILSAFCNSNIHVPEHKIVVNLSPADIPKEGTIYDLPIAIGILAATGVIPCDSIKNSLFMGELSLNGELKHARAVLPLALLAKRKKLKNIYIPFINQSEIKIVRGINAYPVKDLKNLILHLNELERIPKVSFQHLNPNNIFVDGQFDFSEVLGQEQAKRALEIAASGFHNVLLSGPPGTGKTLLARCLPSILPVLDETEIIETTRIYSIAGMLNDKCPLIINPPFRNPHHTVSRIGLIGGGSKPMPGEISLAHRGVLFLDEFAEFPRSVLEALRQPLEDGFVTITRAQGKARFPTRFILIASTNPCPCGNYGNRKKMCICSTNQIIKYQKKISGPIIDRIDINIVVPHISKEKADFSNEKPEESRIVRKRIVKARQRQIDRYELTKNKTNAELTVGEVRKFCKMSKQAKELLLTAIDTYSLSIRSYIKLIKISQTIADISQDEFIHSKHIAEALQYRVEFRN
jgi:magnesium chelatase family protein